jgi:hypothetical protein
MSFQAGFIVLEVRGVGHSGYDRLLCKRHYSYILWYKVYY